MPLWYGHIFGNTNSYQTCKLTITFSQMFYCAAMSNTYMSIIAKNNSRMN